MSRHILCIRTAALSVLIGGLSPATLRAQTSFRSTDSVDLSVLEQVQIEKVIDFDEAKLGNVEDTPMYWVRHRAPGFPHYVSGRFDRQVGHGAPPSFRLDLDGRSVAYHYRHPIIRVTPDRDYRVSAWIKTSRLDNARAWLSAYFLDGSGRPFEESTRYSPLFGGDKAHIEWQPITLFLSGHDERATHLGLSVWLVQRDRWQEPLETPRWIDYEDLKGSAWFDDIEVAPLPRRLLTTRRPGNVFDDAETAELILDVRDTSAQNLTARLELHDAAGRLIDLRPVPIRGRQDPPLSPVEYPNLRPGLYQARLILETPNGVFSETSLTLAKLAPVHAGGQGRSTQFGIVLPNLDLRYLEADRELLSRLNIGRVKFPIHQELIARDDPIAIINPQRDAFLRRLVASRKQLIAAFTDGRQTPAADDPSAGSFLDMLDADPSGWQSALALALAHFADMAFVWQLGADGAERYHVDPRLDESLALLRGELRRILNDPNLVAPWSVFHTPPETPLAASILSIHVPAALPVINIEDTLRDIVDSFAGEAWAVVEPPPDSHYFRRPRLADYAKRLIHTRSTSTKTVFAPRLWKMRERLGDRVLEPTEEYLVFRTVADVLGVGRLAGSMYLGPTVECRIFDHSGQAVLALWDDEAPPQGNRLSLYLGTAPMQIDIWGRQIPTPLEDGKHVVTATRSPRFVLGLDTWLQRFRAGFALDPDHLESSVAVHEPHIVFSNPSNQSITGEFRLQPPNEWDIRPNRFRFALAPGEPFRQRLTIRVPRNESAGQKLLFADFTIDADRPYALELAAPFEFGLRDVDVESSYELDANRLTLRVVATNRSQQSVSFRLFVQAPGRTRQERFIHDLPPGRMSVKEFTFPQPRGLVGQRVWVAMRELHGSRVRNEWVNIQ